MKLDVARTWKELTNTEMLAVYGGNGPATVNPQAEHQNAVGGLVKNVLGPVTEIVANAPLNTITSVFAPISSPTTNVPIYIYLHDSSHNIQPQISADHQHEAQHQYDDQHQAQEQSALATSTATNPANTTGSNAPPSAGTPGPGDTGATAAPVAAHSCVGAFDGFDS
jgi:hypothetical protein